MEQFPRFSYVQMPKRFLHSAVYRVKRGSRERQTGLAAGGDVMYFVTCIGH
jgi:hypothetical protein